jgi:hypothetical protein
MAKKSKKKVSNIMLVISCAMIILYAVANFILQYYTSVEVSPTLTEHWFKFWSAEIFLLAGIKISKVFKGTKDDAQDIVEEEEIVEE